MPHGESRNAFAAHDRNFRDFPEAICELTRLHLPYSSLTEFPEELWSLRKLAYITARENNFPPEVQAYAKVKFKGKEIAFEPVEFNYDND